MENWLAFFKYEGKREDIMRTIIENDQYISKAHNRFTKFTQDEKMIELYNSREKFEHDKATALCVAREEGLEQGDKERSIITATIMKSDGLPIDTIIKYTSLTKEEIENL